MTAETVLDILHRTVADLPDPGPVLIAATVIVLATAMLCGHMTPPLPENRTREDS